MSEQPTTPHYHGGQGSSAAIIAWLLVVLVLFMGLLLCAALSLGIAGG